MLPIHQRDGGAILKAHVDKMDKGEGGNRPSGKQSGPDVGRRSEPRRRLTDEDPTFLDDSDQVDTGEAPDRSPLTLELDPQSEVTTLLDYEEDTADQDPEIVAAVANIPTDDVEMQEEGTGPVTDFNPEMLQHGFDQHFGRGTATPGPGSASPVTTKDDELLNSPTKKTPGEGRPGSCPNSGQEPTGQK